MSEELFFFSFYAAKASTCSWATWKSRALKHLIELEACRYPLCAIQLFLVHWFVPSAVRGHEESGFCKW